ncbi:flagellar basal body L-ring protein FlgH [Govanella unica]|uniref:Flagellar L-ring protein n=1 Tax=Govanella unica TaxID=2975056 RepID=A0A9X3Z6H5_9PROT|nr:flagellar basal body L-ring protein FlgH [Govania unica]MDA5193215.1 flagellar basal body L-ring protein FlgH [Govania unica]
MTRLLLRTSLIAAAALTLAACGAADRIANIGKAPDLSAVNPGSVPASTGTFQQSAAVAATPQTEDQGTSNSIWRSGSRHFFKDPRAGKTGDILTVLININDSAKVDNSTTRARTNSSNTAIPVLPFGLGKSGSLVDASSSVANKGTGKVDRSEAISLTVAAIVTKVLPNGNMVIQGRQQVRVNYELRDLTVAGIVRPEDISSTNTIKHTQIAEARVSYGGKGQITDLQQPPYGQQLYEILSPF